MSARPSRRHRPGTPCNALPVRRVGPVFGDRVRLDQVLTNIVSNAIKYSPEGGVIRVTLERHASTAVLSVSDQGQGYPSA